MENDYTFPMVTHFAIEPHGAIAAADSERPDLLEPVQHPYLLQRMMADLFELPLTEVRVFAPDPAEASAAKQNPKFEPLLAFLAIGRAAVRLVLTLEETFQAVRRTAAQVRVRTGFTTGGSILFHDIQSDYLLGAYADIAERVMAKANYLACGPYRYRRPASSRGRSSRTQRPAAPFAGSGRHRSWAVESQLERGVPATLAWIRWRSGGATSRQREAVVPGDTPADGQWEQSARKPPEQSAGTLRCRPVAAGA